MESYHKRKKKLEEKYGKLINVRPYNDELANHKIASERAIAAHRQQKYIKEIQDISDEEGLKGAYEANDGLHQHYNKNIYSRN